MGGRADIVRLSRRSPRLRRRFEGGAMKRLTSLAVAAFAALAAVPTARGDDVPFAQPGIGGSPVALSDIMADVQLRHIKLWEAIQGRNWPLVRFEATLIGESLGQAAMLYRNIPIEDVTNATAPLADLKSDSAPKDAAKLEAIFARLTTACNACHTAAEIPFIEIKTPSTSPFSDQRFAPSRK
jgi:hypothetical protein